MRVTLRGSPELEACAVRADLSIVLDERDADVLVVEPGHAIVTPLPRVLWLREPGSDDLVAPKAIDSAAIRADAYAADEESLAAAVRFAAAPPKATTLAIRYLGSLGERRPPALSGIGLEVPLDRTIELGRMDTCTIVLRQGAHSDQNTVARRHARIEPCDGGVMLVDLGSTNGTFVRDALVKKTMLHVGDEIAIAWSHRFVIVGP